MARMLNRLPKIGDNFGRWTVVGIPTTGRKITCQCRCGTVKEVEADNLTRRKTTGCRSCRGRLPRSVVTTPRGTSKLEQCVLNVIRRCVNPDHPNYVHYGARGISVYKPWLDNPAEFVAYLATLPNHDSPGMVIDRIRNNEGYEPGNLRFITHAESMTNTRRSIFVTRCGETMCLKSWCRKLGLSYAAVQTRLRNGWEIEAALTTPIASRPLRKEEGTP